MKSVFRDETSGVVLGIELCLVVALLGIIEGALGLSGWVTNNWEIASMVLGSIGVAFLLGAMLFGWATAGKLVAGDTFEFRRSKAQVLALLACIGLALTVLAGVRYGLGAVSNTATGIYWSELVLGIVFVVVFVVAEYTLE